MISVLEGTMMLSGFVTIALASVMIPVVYIIFRYTMKEKSYDERMAEQRKELSEHNSKSKAKHQPVKKSAKKVEKERLHSDKKKIAPPSKDPKKSDASRNNPPVSSSADKADTPNPVPKKKSEKVHSKVSNSSPSLKSTPDDVDEKQRSSSDTYNTPDKSGGDVIESDGADDSTVGSASTVSTSENDAGSYTVGNQSENGSGDNVPSLSSIAEGAACSVADKPAAKSKSANNPATQFGQSDGADKKSTQSESSTKKQALKAEPDAALGKSSQKSEDKTKDSKSSKHKAEEKEKVEVEKSKEYSPLSTAPPSTDSVIDEERDAQEAKKDVDDSADASGDAIAKLEKSPSSTSAKKSNPNAAGLGSGGKTSPIPKNQRQGNNAKNVKKQTTDMKALQKISNEGNGPMNVTLLIPLLAKAELSRSEIQNLIDLLLNKQQDSTVDAEWIGSGRQDPMVKLKKQLAEKEKALTEEQEAHQALQSKLKELRTELNNEKHANRQREETLSSRQTDMQALNARLQVLSDEKQNLVKQMQQLQSKLNEERMISRSLKEETAKTKNNLQQELLSQRQQLEMHIAHISEQHQATVMQLEGNLAAVHARLQEQESANGQMTEEIVIMRDRITVLDQQIAHYQQTHPATQDLMMQLEESRNVRSILERDLNSSQFEANRLNGELRSLTEQLNRKNAENEKFNCIVNNVKIENEELLKENTRINEQINLAFKEKAHLQMEYDELKKQLVDMRENQQTQEFENETYHFQQLLTEKTNELQQLQERLAQLDASGQDPREPSAELDEKKKTIDELNDKLTKQVEKNEDLRRKNWKVMEALSNMEKTLESKVKGMPHSSHEIKLKEREELAKNIVKNLPHISESNLKLPSSYEDNAWFSYIEKIFSELKRTRPAENESQLALSSEETTISTDNNVPVLNELEKQNNQLSTMVSRYKRIISDTEGMLSSLQNHIEQEENRWSEQVRALSEQLKMTNEKVGSMQTELNTLADERNRLLDKVRNIQNGCAEYDVSEQKLNGRANKCLPLTASSSVNEIVASQVR